MKSNIIGVVALSAALSLAGGGDKLSEAKPSVLVAVHSAPPVSKTRHRPLTQ